MHYSLLHKLEVGFIEQKNNIQYSAARTSLSMITYHGQLPCSFISKLYHFSAQNLHNRIKLRPNCCLKFRNSVAITKTATSQNKPPCCLHQDQAAKLLKHLEAVATKLVSSFSPFAYFKSRWRIFAGFSKNLCSGKARDRSFDNLENNCWMTCQDSLSKVVMTIVTFSWPNWTTLAIFTTSWKLSSSKR